MKKNHLLLSVLFSIILPFFGTTQGTPQGNVGISSDNSSPDPSSILDVKSTTRGMLVPRMSSVQRAAISSPATGLLVFDTDTNDFWYYNGSSWLNISKMPSQIADADNDTKIQVEETTDDDIIRFDLAGSERMTLIQNTNFQPRLEIGTGSNLAVGDDALLLNDLALAFGNTAIGNLTLGANTSGDGNTGIGYSALSENTTGYCNTANGFQSLYSNTTGHHNTANGYLSLFSNTEGFQNTANGYLSLYSNTIGFSNTANGYKSLFSNTGGYYNTAYGEKALYSNTTGKYNVAIGLHSLQWNKAKRSNTAIGSDAMYYADSTSLGSESFNTAVGSHALRGSSTILNNTGYHNTAIGASTLLNNTSGYGNVAIGYQSLFSNTTGYHNTANGYESLYSNTTGDYNTANGDKSLFSNTSGYQNTANGYLSLYSNTEGNYNTVSGYATLYANTTGDYNTALGYSTFSLGSAYSNSTGIGYNAEPGASNTVRIGNSTVTSIGGYEPWTNLSDSRFKIDVVENIPGLVFITKLRPVSYRLNMDALAAFNKTPDSLRLYESEALKAAEIRTGFIAQEVEAVAQSIGYDFHGVDKPKNETSHYGLRYAEFTVPLVKAVQEQQAMIESQQAMIEELKEQNKEVGELKTIIMEQKELIQKQSDMLLKRIEALERGK